MIDNLTLRPIGIIRTPFKRQEGTPIQPRYAEDAVGQVVLDDEFKEGLKDLEGFERIWLIYFFDRAKAWHPLVVPYRDVQKRGVFATRAPARPCPIGLSVVELISINDNGISVRRVDMLDNTPLLDIKPYIPGIDSNPKSRTGWFGLNARDAERADDRFTEPD